RPSARRLGSSRRRATRHRGGTSSQGRSPSAAPRTGFPRGSRGPPSDRTPRPLPGRRPPHQPRTCSPSRTRRGCRARPCRACAPSPPCSRSSCHTLLVLVVSYWGSGRGGRLPGRTPVTPGSQIGESFGVLQPHPIGPLDVLVEAPVEVVDLRVRGVAVVGAHDLLDAGADDGIGRLLPRHLFELPEHPLTTPEVRIVPPPGAVTSTFSAWCELLEPALLPRRRYPAGL